MAVDPVVAWRAVVDHLGSNPWSRFVTESYGLLLLGSDGPVSAKLVGRSVVTIAGEAGWRTAGSEPSEQDVSWSFSDSRALLELFGLLAEDGDWANRRYRLTPAGETTMLAMLRATAAGPRDRP